MKKLKIFVMIILCIFMVSCDSNTQNVDSAEPYYSVNLYSVSNEESLPFSCDMQVGERYTQFIYDYEHLIYFADNHYRNLHSEGRLFLDEALFKDNYVIFTAYNDISANKYNYFGLNIDGRKININYSFSYGDGGPGGTIFTYTFIKVPKSIFPIFFNHKKDFLFNFNFIFDENTKYYLQYNYHSRDFRNPPLELEDISPKDVYGMLYTYDEFLDFSSKHVLNKYYIDETFFEDHFVIYRFYKDYSYDMYNNFSYSVDIIYLDCYVSYSSADSGLPGNALDITFIPKSLLKEDFEYKYDYNFEISYKGLVEK